MSFSALNRRQFFKTSVLGCAALSLPKVWGGKSDLAASQTASEYESLMRGLVREWGEAMLTMQIHQPADPTVHGALGCPACGFIHGRCLDAVYPFLHLAKHTGQDHYLQAGIAVFDWSRNVSLPNGAWTVIPDPKSWTGITVFGAIALAETLHFHSDLLSPAIRTRWTARLRQAAG